MSLFLYKCLTITLTTDNNYNNIIYTKSEVENRLVCALCFESIYLVQYHMYGYYLCVSVSLVKYYGLKVS